jgi:predicted RNA-binding protein with PUA-like domain
MRYWLMKTEPGVFSFDDLVKAKGKTTAWEGVRNYQARNFMRDGMKLGDKVFIYHSGTDDPHIAGVAEVVKEAYPDKSALDPKSDYFDEDSKKKGESRWSLVDVKATHRLKAPFTIKDARSTAGLEKMPLIQKGQRLSIQPVTESEWRVIIKKAGTVEV